jgi:hypothetical protein
MKKASKLNKSKPNMKVIAYSVIALVFVALTFLVDWLFIIGAVIMGALSQKELMKNLKEIFPTEYGDDIAAHHSSLSKAHRFATEENLRAGRVQVLRAELCLI